MPFALTKTVLGYGLLIDISAEEYQAVSNAKKCLFDTFYLEQKLDIVVEDYFEFEMELLASSTRQMAHRNQGYSWFQEEVNKLNRRVVNLLSACRLYLEQSLYHLSSIYGEKAKQVEIVKKHISKEYSSKLGYRVMEAIRNYVQHRGLPVHKWTYNAKRIENKGKSQVLFTLTPFISVQELREDEKFKKAVVDELEQIAVEIDIKPLVREYVGCIGSIHESIRSVIREDVLTWEKSLFTCIDKFKERTSSTEDISGLAAVMIEDNGTYTGILPIFTEFILHRKQLERKNRSLANLSISYVTSEIIQ